MGEGHIMRERKFPAAFKEGPFIEGYMDSLIRAGQMPCYGYPENHLPDTRSPSREIESAFALAKKER